ncbi:uncharacterized protein BO87DRAFT_233317 [Aspergillus neoniger CBS 115656]|uniref:Uncharacterized protein n=1 Tax=Aspergillus neoniger (strain CBS 115656) TaxID=1448310 RepID=A0A318YR22_ASPNB|nr:hypothetical protein BO87DRAFT_233317 [Aspergillus neoniger CBS 115656]PYH36859.1 hypothetical protein BO87DRAFT_233317 [Aspergillus neoniger CBS 115656]
MPARRTYRAPARNGCFECRNRRIKVGALGVLVPVKLNLSCLAWPAIFLVVWSTKVSILFSFFYCCFPLLTISLFLIFSLLLFSLLPSPNSPLPHHCLGAWMPE